MSRSNVFPWQPAVSDRQEADSGARAEDGFRIPPGEGNGAAKVGGLLSPPPSLLLLLLLPYVWPSVSLLGVFCVTRRSEAFGRWPRWVKWSCESRRTISYCNTEMRVSCSSSLLLFITEIYDQHSASLSLKATMLNLYSYFVWTDILSLLKMFFRQQLFLVLYFYSLLIDFF